MEKEITIVGGGLVGSLFSILLARENFHVNVFDRRPDPLKVKFEGGRSINLALSYRGLKALRMAGLAEKALEMAIPMKGRMIHDVTGKLNFQAYGDEGQVIYSISRSGLNELIISSGINLSNLHFKFNTRCTEVDFHQSQISFIGETHDTITNKITSPVFATDGAFSAVRFSMLKTEGFNYSQEYLDYSYKELTIPSDGGKHRMEKNALHIWPRENFMLIALPNADGSFTCTLFLSTDGDISFNKLNTPDHVVSFFRTYFPDALELMPSLADEFFHHPSSVLLTIKCFPWKKDNVLLLGDAAHAIVPFYGQGMNAGFEDCRIFMELLKKNKNDFLQTMDEFQHTRKESTDAIADLALRNFIEMRDLVNDKDFLLRKKIEAVIHKKYGEKYLPLYSMVTFSDLSYAEAKEMSIKQDKLFDKILKHPGINEKYNQDAFWPVIENYLKEYFKM